MKFMRGHYPKLFAAAILLLFVTSLAAAFSHHHHAHGHEDADHQDGCTLCHFLTASSGFFIFASLPFYLVLIRSWMRNVADHKVCSAFCPTIRSERAPPCFSF